METLRGRLRSSFLAPSRSEGVPKGDLGRSGLASGASKASILLLFEGYFARMDQLARRRAEPHFDSVWASPNEVRRFRAQVQNRRKIVPDRLVARVAQEIVCEDRFFHVWRPQNSLQELSGASWEAS